MLLLGYHFLMNWLSFNSWNFRQVWAGVIPRRGLIRRKVNFRWKRYKFRKWIRKLTMGLFFEILFFKVLYLANKYLIKDLDKFCRNFIINNKTKKSLPKDVFKVKKNWKTQIIVDILRSIHKFRKRAKVYQELDSFWWKVLIPPRLQIPLWSLLKKVLQPPVERSF